MPACGRKKEPRDFGQTFSHKGISRGPRGRGNGEDQTSSSRRRALEEQRVLPSGACIPEEAAAARIILGELMVTEDTEDVLLWAALQHPQLTRPRADLPPRVAEWLASALPPALPTTSMPEQEDCVPLLLVSTRMPAGHPTDNFCRIVATRLVQWAALGHVPGMDAPEDLLARFEVEDCQPEMDKHKMALLRLLRGIYCDESDSSTNEHAQRLLEELGSKGLMVLLGARFTRLSVPHAYLPTRSTLLAAFRAPQSTKPGITLSVGGRAWMKHQHRSRRDLWWGEFVKGGDAKKNALAEAAVLRVLAEAVWMNSHYLPGHVPVFEVRTEAGYGARWSASGTVFVGFLEPFRADGWRNKFKS